MVYLSLSNAISWTSISSTKAIRSSQRPLSKLIIRACSNSTGVAISDTPLTKYSGVILQETVDVNTGKLRLDSWISSRIHGISRARVQSSIRSGLVCVNGRVIDKVPLSL